MLTFRAPARIQLYLQVVGKQDSGLPEMVAMNQTIDLCDHLSIRLCEHDQLPLEHSGILESITAYRDFVEESFPVAVELQRNAPEHLNLGLNDSHCATVLWAINQLSSNSLGEESLKKIAAKISPDVSFFFSHGTAKCLGNGEIIEEEKPEHKYPFWLVSSPYAIPSEKIYHRFTMVDLRERILKKITCYYNDLEESAFALDPKLGLRKQQMKDLGFQTVVMAGTGPSLYCMNGPSDKLSKSESYQTQYLNRDIDNWY